MTMITGTRSVTGSDTLNLTIFTSFVIDTIMAVTKYIKQPTKLSTKQSPKLRSF